MGKYLIYAVILLILAFGLNFFGVVDIPWLDVPFSLESKEEGGKKIKRAADEALGESQERR